MKIIFRFPIFVILLFFMAGCLKPIPDRLTLMQNEGAIFGRLAPLAKAEQAWAMLARENGSAQKIEVDQNGFFLVQGKSGVRRLVKFVYQDPTGVHTVAPDPAPEFEIVAGEVRYVGQVIFSPVTEQVYLTDDFVRDRLWLGDRLGREIKPTSAFSNEEYYRLMERYFDAEQPAARRQDVRALVSSTGFLMGDVWPGSLINSPGGLDLSQIPPHEVFVSSFLIDLYPVTAAALGRESERVAVRVSWEQADEYCRKQGGKLPTEAQWELAARGPRWRTHRYAGALLPGEEIGDGPAPVIGLAGWTESPYGAYFAADRLLEWTADWYHPASFSTSTGENPTGPATGTRRVARAGPYRFAVRPQTTARNLGFRCAYDVPVPGETAD